MNIKSYKHSSAPDVLKWTVHITNIFARNNSSAHTNIGLIYLLSSNGINTSCHPNAFSLRLIVGLSVAASDSRFTRRRIRIYN